MKAQRRNRSLEVLARSIKDSEDFVTHVSNIAAAVGNHYARNSAAGREMRQALRGLAKHAGALSDWLQSAARSGSSIESQALRQLSVASGNPTAFGESVAMRAWLSQLAAASDAAADAPPDKSREDALRLAADGLRGTFEHHGLKLSQRAAQQKQSDAVRLLCAMVGQADTAGLDTAEAKQWLQGRNRAAGRAQPADKKRPASQAPVRSVRSSRKQRR
jgi:hypothetical protein